MNPAPKYFPDNSDFSGTFCFTEPNRGSSKKIFVGRLPQEATAEDLREYFSRFGNIVDVYVPKVM